MANGNGKLYVVEYSVEQVTEMLKVPALPSPIYFGFGERYSGKWMDGAVNAGNTVYCRVCEKKLTDKPNDFMSVYYHMKSHFPEEELRAYYGWNRQASAESMVESIGSIRNYLIIMNNAEANKIVHKIERQQVASLKVKGSKLICRMCNKDISRTPDKARHLASHFAEKKLPSDFQKFLEVVA